MAKDMEAVFALCAKGLHDAPGGGRLAHLARTAKHIPAPLLHDLEELIVRLDDTELVGNDVFIHLIEVGYCDARYADAAKFLSAFAKRLRTYVDDAALADAARRDFRKFVAWWRTGLNRTADLRRRLAVILT